MSVVLEITDYHNCPAYWQKFIDHLGMDPYDPDQNRTIEEVRAQQKKIITAALEEYSASLLGDFGGHQCIFEHDVGFILFKLRWS